MADPTIFSYELLDDEGLKNSTSLYMAYDGVTVTEAEMEAAWVAYGALIDPCIDPQILKGAITIPLQAPTETWKQTPAVGNNVNQVMNLNFNNDFNNYATSILLPGYKESILGLTRLPDLTDPALSALIAAILTGEPSLLPAFFPNSRDLHDLNALRDAFLTVRKVRNQKRHTVVTP